MAFLDLYNKWKEAGILDEIIEHQDSAGIRRTSKLMVYYNYDAFRKCGQRRHNAVFLTAQKLGISERQVYYVLDEVEKSKS